LKKNCFHGNLPYISHSRFTNRWVGGGCSYSISVGVSFQGKYCCVTLGIVSILLVGFRIFIYTGLASLFLFYLFNPFSLIISIELTLFLNKWLVYIYIYKEISLISLKLFLLYFIRISCICIMVLYKKKSFVISNNN